MSRNCETATFHSTCTFSIDDATTGTADGSIGNDTRSTTMFGVALGIDRDGSYIGVETAMSATTVDF